MIGDESILLIGSRDGRIATRGIVPRRSTAELVAEVWSPIGLDAKIVRLPSNSAAIEISPQFWVPSESATA